MTSVSLDPYWTDLSLSSLICKMGLLSLVRYVLRSTDKIDVKLVYLRYC